MVTNIHFLANIQYLVNSAKMSLDQCFEMPLCSFCSLLQHVFPILLYCYIRNILFLYSLMWKKNVIRKEKCYLLHSP